MTNMGHMDPYGSFQDSMFVIQVKMVKTDHHVTVTCIENKFHPAFRHVLVEYMESATVVRKLGVPGYLQLAI